jgi:hypothetical protein
MAAVKALFNLKVLFLALLTLIVIGVAAFISSKAGHGSTASTWC